MAAADVPNVDIMSLKTRAGAIRTVSEERAIQEFTPEQRAWRDVVELHKVREAYAREMAKNVLAKIEGKRVRLGIQAARDIYESRKFLRELFETLYQVSHDHVELACDLVQEVAAVRYAAYPRVLPVVQP